MSGASAGGPSAGGTSAGGPSAGGGEDAAEERERAIERVADRLDAPMTVLGIIFLLLVVAETAARAGSGLARALSIVSWVLWGAFVAELVIRTLAAPSPVRYLRRHWWQVVFLALPFLRFLRILSRLRVAQLSRSGRVISSAVRGARTATRSLTGRLGWLSGITVVMVLGGGQVAYQWLEFATFGAALHAVALATITGASLQRDSGLAQVLDVVFAIYSVAVFAALAGALGAWFLERRGEAERQVTAEGSDRS